MRKDRTAHVTIERMSCYGATLCAERQCLWCLQTCRIAQSRHTKYQLAMRRVHSMMRMKTCAFLIFDPAQVGGSASTVRRSTQKHSFTSHQLDVLRQRVMPSMPVIFLCCTVCSIELSDNVHTYNWHMPVQFARASSVPTKHHCDPSCFMMSNSCLTMSLSVMHLPGLKDAYVMEKFE